MSARGSKSSLQDSCFHAWQEWLWQVKSISGDCYLLVDKEASLGVGFERNIVWDRLLNFSDHQIREEVLLGRCDSQSIN